MPDKRIALVIGNAAYGQASPLKTPLNDAKALTEVLERLEFDVTVDSDCNVGSFQKQLRTFASRVDANTVALLYYSGHGLQYDGENYLVPIDAQLEVPEDLVRLAFPVMEQVQIISRKAKLTLFFLDACRDSPFRLRASETNSYGKSAASATIGLSGISQEALTSSEAFIAFAAEQGKIAKDGEEGGISPFAQALCDNLEAPGLSIAQMMLRVKRSVVEATRGEQRPWVTDALTKDFAFKPGAVTGQLQTEPTPPDIDVGQREPPPSPEPLPKTVVPHQADRPKSISARLPNLAAGIESFAKDVGPIVLAFLSMAMMFVLLFISQAIGLHLIKLPQTGKEVGFMAAPNWSIVYTILFPFYLFLFGTLADRVRIMLSSLIKHKFILGPQGEIIAESALFAAWRQALQKISLLLWIMLGFIALQTGVEWYTTCLMPYFGGNVIVVDWTTSAIHGTEAERFRSIVFSAAAYLYMAVALYVYLAILVYAATVCYFLNTLADPTGEFRLIMRDETLGKQFSFIGTVIYWSVILGLGAGFMMRLQAIYLASGYLIVTDLIFSDVWGWLGRPPQNVADAAGGTIPSAWTGMLEIVFTLLILFACCLSLFNAFERAKQYYLDNIDDLKWRKLMRVNHAPDSTEFVRRLPFLKTVFPMYAPFGFVVGGIVASAVFIGYSSIALVTLLYFVVTFMIVPAFRRDRSQMAN